MSESQDDGGRLWTHGCITLGGGGGGVSSEVATATSHRVCFVMEAFDSLAIVKLPLLRRKSGSKTNNDSNPQPVGSQSEPPVNGTRDLEKPIRPPIKRT